MAYRLIKSSHIMLQCKNKCLLVESFLSSWSFFRFIIIVRYYTIWHHDSKDIVILCRYAMLMTVALFQVNRLHFNSYLKLLQQMTSLFGPRYALFDIDCLSFFLSPCCLAVIATSKYTLFCYDKVNVHQTSLFKCGILLRY